MIERNLYTYLAKLLHTSVRVYDANDVLLEVINHAMSDTLQDELPPDVEKFILSRDSCGCPITVQIADAFIYSLLYTPNGKLLVGPNRLILSFYCRHSYQPAISLPVSPENVFQTDIYYYQSILIPTFNLYYENMTTDEYYFSTNFYNIADENVQRSFTKAVFQNREESHSHNPYSQEIRMLSSIETGDLNLLERCRNEDIHSNFGTLSNNYSRNIKNLCICVVTLVSRAAIKGGLNYELAFSLCDSYIMQIENTTDLYEIGILTENAKTRFCTMVKESNERKEKKPKERLVHPLTEKAKDYIFKHLHEKVTLYDVADALDTSPNYLSNLFLKYESKSFSDFVRDEKVSLIKNLLVYSTYSYIEIANYLGFSSQSHIGRVFKKATGYTLKDYRDRYSNTEFIQ